jgi:hypothetical protein
VACVPLAICTLSGRLGSVDPQYFPQAKIITYGNSMPTSSPRLCRSRRTYAGCEAMPIDGLRDVPMGAGVAPRIGNRLCAGSRHQRCNDRVQQHGRVAWVQPYLQPALAAIDEDEAMHHRLLLDRVWELSHQSDRADATHLVT